MSSRIMVDTRLTAKFEIMCGHRLEKTDNFSRAKRGVAGLFHKLQEMFKVLAQKLMWTKRVLLQRVTSVGLASYHWEAA